jgi:hypothetical protein
MHMTMNILAPTKLRRVDWGMAEPMAILLENTSHILKILQVFSTLQFIVITPH